MAEHIWTEEDFDDEFNRLVVENESCPTCNRPPVELGNVKDNDGNLLLTAICEIGHMYIVTPQEDDGEEEDVVDLS